MKLVDTKIPIERWSGAEATNELHKTIVKFNEVSENQTNQMLKLTRVIALLTFVMLLGLGVQIYLAVNNSSLASTSKHTIDTTKIETQQNKDEKTPNTVKSDENT